MKKLFYMLLIVVTTMQGIAQQTSFDRNYLKTNNTYCFNDELKLTISSIFTNYKFEFGLNDFDEMRVERTIVDGENTFTKFVQFHKGYQVENSMINANGQNGVILNVNGEVVKGLNVNILNYITEDNALANALESIGATEYTWQNMDREKNLKEELENPNATSYPKGKLIIVPQSGNFSTNTERYILAWKFTIEALEPYSLNTIYINAINGTIIYNLNSTSDSYNYNNAGTGWTHYNGSFNNLGTRTCSGCSNYSLYSNKNIQTWQHSKSRLIKDNNNNWVESSYNNCDERKTAASAHWSIERVWDYYLNHFGRWGSDYAGKIVKLWVGVYVNVSPVQSNTMAKYHTDMDDNDAINLKKDNTNYSAPSGTNLGKGFSVASFDILAHEYAHAMIKRSSQLVNYGESGALNEGFADIFASLAEKYTFGTTSWEIGPHASFARHIDEPHNDSYSLDYYNSTINTVSAPSPTYWGENFGSWWKQSQYYFPQNPLPANTPDNTIHRNGGVLRKWFYLLAYGGSQTINGVTWNVPAIGIDKAERIAYLTFNWYCWSTSHFIDAANGSVQATIDFYGSCSPEHKAVTAAWRAVTNNYPIPLCKRFNIDGLNVIKTQSLISSPVSYTVRFDETGGNPTNIIWTVPEGWNVNINGITLTLNSTTNKTSQKLIATYSEGGIIYTNNIVVHFTDEIVKGDNNLPAYKMNNSETTFDKDKFSIYPNPANDKIAIVLPYEIENATYQFLDINGRILQQGTIYQQATELNTSSIANGLYILNVKAKNYSKIQKVNIIH